MKSKHIIRASIIMLLLSWSWSLSAQTGLFSQDRGLWHGSWNPRFGLEIGTSFMTGSVAGSMFSQSISPQFQFNPNHRLSFVVGSVFTSGQLSGNFVNPFFGMGAAPGNFISSSPNMFSATFYAAGTYQVNERLSISGAGWVERNNLHTFQPRMNPQAFNLNPRGLMVGFDYRIGPNFSFGAQINVNQGYNPFNPFMMPHGLHGGFFPRTPFHPGLNW